MVEKNKSGVRFLAWSYMDIILKARKSTLEQLQESLNDDDLDIAIHALDLYIDYLEVLEDKIILDGM